MNSRLGKMDAEINSKTKDFPQWKITFARDLLQALKIACLFYKDESDKTIEQAQRALEAFSPDSKLARAFVQMVLGYAHLHGGDPLLAEPLLQEAIDISAGVNHSNLMLEAVAHKVDAKRYQGKLRASETLINETMQRVERERFARSPALAKLSVRQAYIDYRRNKLHEAMAHARTSIEYAKHETDPDPLLRAYHVETFIQAALGKPREAAELIEEAREIARTSRSALRMWFIETIAVEVALMLGDLETVSHWAERHEVGIDQPFSSGYERESLLLAKWSLVQGDYPKAIAIISSLRPQSVARQRFDSS